MSQSGKKVTDLNNIFGGGARLVYANDGVTKPTQLSALLNPTTGVLASGWNDLGATDGGLGLTRSYEAEEWEVDQVLAAIDEFITAWNMTIETNLAEVSLKNIQIAWEGTVPILTNAVPTPDEKALYIGDPDCLTERMVAFIVDKRKPTCGGTGYIRAYVFWKTKYNGADSEHRFEKGNKALIPLSLKILPDTDETSERRFGVILDQVVA